MNNLNLPRILPTLREIHEYLDPVNNREALIKESGYRYGWNAAIREVEKLNRKEVKE